MTLISASYPKAESLVRYQANGVEREVRYSQMDLARLEAEMRAAERECSGSTGRRIHTVRLSPSKGLEARETTPAKLQGA